MKYLPVALVLVVLAAGTFLEGRFTDRWGQIKTERLKDFAARIDELPLEFGDWKGVAQEINQEEFEASNCEKCYSVTFTNRDQQSVNCYVVCGTARHVTIHTPDWCYVGAGYTMMEDPQKRILDNVENLKDVNGQPTQPEFLTTVFRKEDVLRSHHIRIFWSFSSNGVWEGPRVAKAEYAGQPALYKIYLITDLDEMGNSKDIETNPTLDFANSFFPVANKILFKQSDQD